MYKINLFNIVNVDVLHAFNPIPPFSCYYFLLREQIVLDGCFALCMLELSLSERYSSGAGPSKFG